MSIHIEHFMYASDALTLLHQHMDFRQAELKLSS